VTWLTRQRAMGIHSSFLYAVEKVLNNRIFRSLSLTFCGSWSRV